MKLFIYLFSTAIIFFSFSNSSFSQKDSLNKIAKDKIVELASSKLQQKILLTDAQTENVKEILSSYLSKNLNSESISDSLSKKVETILNARQKAKYDIIKSEWINYIIKEIEK